MKRFLILTLVIFIFFSFAPGVRAASITFVWDPPTGGTTPTGYKLYYGKASKNYTTNIDVGNVTTYTIANLDISSGGTWFFAVTDYIGTTTKTESGYSNEVSVTFPVNPANFKITITVSP
jgi:hypothetical protein